MVFGVLRTRQTQESGVRSLSQRISFEGWLARVQFSAHVASSLRRSQLAIAKKTMRVPRCCTLLLIHTLLLALLLIGVNAKSATGDRVLVIHEEDSIQSEFSQFFDSLKSTTPPCQKQHF